MPLPERIQNAPELTPGTQLFYTGFLELTSNRSMGAALGPIPFLAILEYCLIKGIEGEQQDNFVWLIQRLDQKYLEWSRSKNNAQPKRIHPPHPGSG